VSVGTSTTLTATFEQGSADTTGIVINEINYNAAADFNPGDWVELYNPGTKAVDISGWHYTDSDPAHLFTFPAGTVLGADQYLVIAEDTTLFRSVFPAVAGVFGSTGFGLSGSGESMKLMNAAMQTMDSVMYDDVSPWPVEADGAGATLELVSALSDNTLGASWKASAGHGTPGRKNSVTTGTGSGAGPALPATTGLDQNYPNPFNGTTQFSFRIANAGHATLKVYDVLGREVADLYEGHCLPGVYAVAFNGSDLASGVYLTRLTVDGFSETRRLILMK
jgi:hypothetical protein